MEHRLNKQIVEIQMSGIRQFNQMASQIEGCIKFTLGEPDFQSHANVKGAIKKALHNNLTHYSANAGLLELRKALADDVYLRYGRSYDEDSICVTIGASEGLSSVLQTILNPNDEVIVLEPGYPAYRPLIELNHAKYVGIDTCKHNFQIDETLLKQHITKQTKAIILTSPNNPTGCIYNDASLQAVYNCMKDLDIFVICDNIYDEITFEEWESYLRYKDQKEKIFLIQSFSKTYAMAGYRLGYVCANNLLMQHVVKTHAYAVSGAPTFIQYAAISALKTSTDKMVQQYKKRRDYAMQRFAEMGIDYIPPQGAFYFFINISKYNKNSYDFAYDLLHKNKVCVVPGRYFGSHCDNYIRLSYACSMKELQEGLNRIENYIKQL